MDLDHGVDGMGVAWVEGTAHGACQVIKGWRWEFRGCSVP